jgi:uncharacterized protein
MGPNTYFSRREFIGLASMAAAGAVFPGPLRGNPPQNPVGNTAVQGGKSSSHEVIPWKVLPFPNQQVRLLDGIFKQQMEINASYLHMLPNGRLAHMFRLTAGLPSTAKPLGGWENPDCELRGHFSGGHYLSAPALM